VDREVWVESNPRRRDSLQDDEPVSAVWSGEPATAWRSLDLAGGLIGGADVTISTDRAHDVVEGGMSRRQSGVSGEVCRQ
jgi:hypothetical protein